MSVLSIPHLLDAAECQALITASEARGFQPATVRTAGGPQLLTAVRNNTRVDFEDAALTALLLDRLRPHLAPRTPYGLDPHLRVYRYAPGERFLGHRDGSVTVDGRVSELSFLVYLNDDFGGGQTNFGRRDERVSVVPDLGMAVLFPHATWHEGAAVTAGSKYVLRTDVVF